MASADPSDLRSRSQLANAFMWLEDGFVAAGRPDSAVVYATMAMETGEEVARTPGAPEWAASGLASYRRVLARAIRHAGRFASAESLYSQVCVEAPFYNATDAIKGWRDWVERAHSRLAAGHVTGADSAFARSEQLLKWVEEFLPRFTRDATPYADVALAYLHLAQVSERDRDRRIGLLEHALSLPHFDADERAVRPLLMNELACALADRGREAEARKMIQDALAQATGEDLRAALRWNLTTLREGQRDESGGGLRAAVAPRYRTRQYDATRDPYARLDITVFRMMTVWGEHPVPPPSRRVPSLSTSPTVAGAATPGRT